MTAHLKISDEVVESTVGDEVILMHLGTGLYFALDMTGSAIWKHIKAGTALETIPGLLAAEFKADIVQIETDVRDLLGELFANGILQKM